LPDVAVIPDWWVESPHPLTGDWAAAAEPPPDLLVSEWSDASRRLPATSGARGGRWQTDRVPYLRGVMDAVHEPGVRTIALKKAAQVGGSEALHNIVGYFIEHDPSPMLFVQPTVDVAEEWSKERLDDMIRGTPALQRVIRELDSTLKLKLFLGGYLAIGGANTPNTFARRSVRIAIGDDVDRFPAVVGDEGDPADLLANRTISFEDLGPLVIFVSTPTLKYGRIDTLYERSDQRRYHVACPACGRWDWVTWNNPAHFRVAFDDRDPATARLECPSSGHGGCGAPLDEPARQAMVRAGTWRATAVAQQTGLVGFHVPAMVSTLGITLPYLVDKWLMARVKGKESTRVFINTALAEGWEDRGARMNHQGLMHRRESYGDDIEAPWAVAAVTCGVDVQSDRFELTVMGWGPAEERWVLDHRVVPGDPRQLETRSALLTALERRYRHASGLDLPIHATCLDTGYATDEMYDFVLMYQARRIFATKGYAGKGGEPIVGKPSEKRPGRRQRPVRLYPINVDDAKASLMSSLALADPPAESVVGTRPGAIHFPTALDTITEEYFAQLCAEHRETRYNRSGIATHEVWVQDRERNEALDCAVLCLAAYRLLNPNIRQMADTIAAAATVATRPRDDGSLTPADPPSTPLPAGRRVARSKYLRGGE